MSLIDLPAKRTPMTADEAGKALSSAYKLIVGKLPSTSILSLLLSQWAVETAKGTAIQNYNYGNTMPTSSDKYRQMLHTAEVINGVSVPKDEWFAAYLTPEDGAKRYIEVLKSRAHWWNGLQSGNIKSFNKGLSTSPVYYTQIPSIYLKALESEISTYLPIAKKYASSFWGVVTQSLIGIALGISGIYVYRSIKHGSYTK